ncbi:alpha-2 adrenergic receptor [Bemisia tabaci]
MDINPFSIENLISKESNFTPRLDGELYLLFDNLTHFLNGTSDLFRNNTTFIILESESYPSGYNVYQIVLATIIVSLLMIIVVVGNMLVIIAIATEKALKNIQNWFIASLAVADFFLGLVIMPFSLANELMGYWIFGNWWCDIHSAMDVLLSTASIMNLCLISLDRYWSITQAVDYLKKRTPARAAVMITLVWILSAVICIPPLLGWKVKRPQEPEAFPKCELSKDIGYVLYSALGSFYIPSCIMVFVYIRIYYAAKARARRGIRKLQRPKSATVGGSSDVKGHADRTTSFTISPKTGTLSLPVHGSASLRSPSSKTPAVTIESKSIPVVTCDFASDVSTSEGPDPGGGPPDAGPPPPPPPTNGGLGVQNLDKDKDTLKVLTISNLKLPSQQSLGQNFKGSTLSINGDLAAMSNARCRAPSVGIDTDLVSEFDPSSSDSGVVSRCAVVKPLKLRLCKPIFGGLKKSSKQKREMIDLGKIGSPHPVEITPGNQIEIVHQQSVKPQKPRDPEREKRRIARKKEKRATLILGLIMGSFIACWLPFFFLYILTPLCSICVIPSKAFAVAFWLGYMNSALNPVIYTIFNKDFRRAFRRILFK